MFRSKWSEYTSNCQIVRPAYWWYKSEDLIVTFNADGSCFGFMFTGLKSLRINLENMVQSIDSVNSSSFEDFNFLEFAAKSNVAVMRIEFRNAIPLPSDSLYIDATKRHPNDYFGLVSGKYPAFELFNGKEFRVGALNLQQTLWDDSIIHILIFAENQVVLVIHDYAGDPGILYFKEVEDFFLRGEGNIYPCLTETRKAGALWETKIWSEFEGEAVRIKFKSIFDSATQ